MLLKKRYSVKLYFRIFVLNRLLSKISQFTSCFRWKILLRFKFAIDPFWINAQNFYYGHDKVAKKYSIDPLTACIKHAVQLSYDDAQILSLCFLEENGKKLRDICVCSSHEKAVVERELQRRELTDIKVHALGPYIAGASFFSSLSKREKLKKELGKILLVIPMHSTESFHLSYSEDDLIQEIERIKKDFDTVIVMMYWHDLLEGQQQKYERRGYRIACSGVRLDPFFLSRQKDLLWLADTVITNGISTHVAYALTLSKPCYYYSQAYQSETDVTAESARITQAEEVVMREGFAQKFGMYPAVITEEQRDLVKKWWGVPARNEREIIQ